MFRQRKEDLLPMKTNLHLGAICGNVHQFMDTNMKLVRFEETELDDQCNRAIMEEINESPETVKICLKELKEKLLDVKDLKANLNDDFLLRYLRGCKFDVKKSFNRLHKYYVVRKKYSEVFDLCYPSANIRARTAKHFKALPFRAADQSAVVIHERKNFCPESIPVQEIFLLDVQVFDYLLENPLTQRCGLSIILDFEGFSLQQFMDYTPQRMRVSVETFLNAFPTRIKGVHIVNASRLVTLLYNLAYPFLTQKVRSRLVIHSDKEDWKSLHSFFPKEILPDKFGGHLSSNDLIDLVDIIFKREDYYLQQLKYGFQ